MDHFNQFHFIHRIEEMENHQRAELVVMEAAIRTIGVPVQRLEQISDQLEVFQALDIPLRQGPAGLGTGLFSGWLGRAHARIVTGKRARVKRGNTSELKGL